ncbi:MAG TPA: hypothetical protein ENN81_02545 [Phycisphaerales bacterium]|nr:hypothetical protein [Phycisphaerales bacterium]
MAKSNSKRRSVSGPNGSHERAGVLVTLPVAGWMLAVMGILIFMLAHVWPASGSEDSGDAVKKLFWAFRLCDETRLLLLVVFAGAIGAQVHALRSFAWYVGTGELTRKWVMYYIGRPFIGAALAPALYFVARALFAPGPAGPAGVYGFVALASLSGLFSETIMAKLKRVADALCGKSGE